MLRSRQTIITRNPAYKPVGLDKTQYEYIKTLEMVGLGISSGYELQDLHTEGCRITPSVTVLSGSPKQVFWDFTTVSTDYNKSSISTVTEYFSEAYFKSGNSFTVSDSSYSVGESNFDGSYTFISFKNGMLVSTTALSLAVKSYTNTKFDSVPVFKAVSPGVKKFGQNEFLITNNVIGSNSFVQNKVTANSILEIAEVKFRVVGIEEKKDKEYVLITGIDRQTTVTIPSFNTLNRTLINLYQQK